MKIKYISSSIIVILFLVSCNTPPSRIAAKQHNGNLPSDCKVLLRQSQQIDNIISTQRSQLQTDANMDAAIVAGSIVLLPVGLFALAATGNGDLKEQYAQNLGKKQAIDNKIEDANCNM